MENEKPATRYFINPALKASILLSTEIRGQGIINSEIDAGHNPQTAKLIIDLLNLKNNSGETAVPSHLVELLSQMGLLVKNQQIPNDIIFKCTPDGSLLPPEISPDLNLDNIPAKYKLNPAVYLAEKQVPPNLKSRIRFNECFSEEYPVLWVEDYKTRILMPFWLSGPEKAIIAALIQGKTDLNSLDQEFLKQLVLAGILLPSAHLLSEADYYQAAGKSLAENGYAVLPALLNPVQTGGIRHYYRALEKKGIIREDLQIEGRYAMHNEPLARYIHHQLQYLMNRLSPEKVKPSYCYLAVYTPGSILKRHTDRRQCAWNISLVIDMEPELKRADAWPIYLDIAGQIHEVKLGMGDAVIYRGTKIPHWRNRLPENQKVTVCFLHFVEQDFQGPLS
jgi:hypothetical protein